MKKYKEHKMVTNDADLDLTDVVPEIPPLPTMEEILIMFDSASDNIPDVPDEVICQTQRPAEIEIISYALPKPIDPKEAQKAQQANRGGSNNQPKKNDKEEPMKFAPIPGAFLEKLPGRAREENFFEQRQKLRAADFPNNAKQAMVNSGIQPCVIREILLLPESPP